MTLNHTHDPARRSWIESANTAATDFPLQNLPYGVFLSGENRTPRIGVAIGDEILNLAALAELDLLPATTRTACRQPTLNTLLAAGPGAWTALRARLSELLGVDSCSAALRTQVESCLVPQTGTTMLLPAAIGGYTDFYAGICHATNVGTMLRPENPLLPNYKWVPIGYHGRSSSIVVSGTAVRRPRGQLNAARSDAGLAGRRPNVTGETPQSAAGNDLAFKSADQPAPVFGPCKNLDYELELGAFVGPGNPQGSPISLAAAAEHLFGVVLLNDWSARDVQAWEYQPLGPFLAKNFATTISPWVVTLEALAPFRLPAYPRAADDPAPLPYLAHPDDQAAGGLDLTFEVSLLTPKMRETGAAPHRLSRGSFAAMYWTFAQMLAHHASNGCNLQPGDLLGSGTISGPTKDARGCLLELTWRGTEPIKLPDGEERKFLADGDEVIMRGWAERPGARRIGLGECRGVVLPAAT